MTKTERRRLKFKRLSLLWCDSVAHYANDNAMAWRAGAWWAR